MQKNTLEGDSERWRGRERKRERGARCEKAANVRSTFLFTHLAR